MDGFMLVLVLLVLGFQLFVSWRLLASTELTTTQKVAQICLIWLLPLLGALVIHLFLRNLNGQAPVLDRRFVQQDEQMTDLLD
ncbi:hypothetical protein [Uliginosibacterium gangwonense]|uniref:hypothetical protein n=1 Tax=Uliginosibacterium gangwonense TaxID=392736 RepID=UPI00036B6E64|nr:hypothetical protein [Uliginosibacterium gangwonense]